MKVAIIGCGIMGSSMAAWFSDCGAEVFAVDVWKDHVDTINKKGLIIEHHLTKEQKLYTNIKAYTSPAAKASPPPTRSTIAAISPA